MRETHECMGVPLPHHHTPKALPFPDRFYPDPKKTKKPSRTSRLRGSKKKNFDLRDKLTKLPTSPIPIDQLFAIWQLRR